MTVDTMTDSSMVLASAEIGRCHDPSDDLVKRGESDSSPLQPFARFASARVVDLNNRSRETYMSLGSYKRTEHGDWTYTDP